MLPENILALSYPVRYAAGVVAIFLSPRNEGLEPFQEFTAGGGVGWRGLRMKAKQSQEMESVYEPQVYHP